VQEVIDAALRSQRLSSLYFQARGRDPDPALLIQAARGTQPWLPRQQDMWPTDALGPFSSGKGGLRHE
jgi:hypothetical protein